MRRALFLLLGILGIASAAHAERLVSVTHVRDGDTVEIDHGEPVRLLGIDTPEGKRKARVGQPFFLEAKNFLAQLVDKKRVKMIIGDDPVDIHWRTLGYLYLKDGTDVQQKLIRAGYAMVSAYWPNLQHLDAYGKTEAEVCRARRGLWGHSYFALRDLDTGAKIRYGTLGRVQGTVTAVKRTPRSIEIVLSDRVTLRTPYWVWRKFWPNKNPKELVGQRLIARGTISKRKVIGIYHPFMLRDQPCAAGGMAS